MSTLRYVVDASVVAKWILQGEPYQESATKLKNDFASGTVLLSAPAFITQEVGNALWRGLRLGRITEEDAQAALEALNDMSIKLHESDWTQVSQALSIACKLDLVVYDAMYLFFSDKMKASLITADDKLYEKSRRHFEVIHIRDYV
jgi:predicted nucleic acid-binding protein